MALLRRVIGETLRRSRLRQRRTLREVSVAARVSLGYLSEIERGQKEASSELLAAICAALGIRMSDLLREASDHMVRAETPMRQVPAVPRELVGVAGRHDGSAAPVPHLPPVPRLPDRCTDPVRNAAKPMFEPAPGDGPVSGHPVEHPFEPVGNQQVRLERHEPERPCTPAGEAPRAASDQAVDMAVDLAVDVPLAAGLDAASLSGGVLTLPSRHRVVAAA